ncbi:hypothetical protein [Streptomyces platensis]|uniref:hypothetical protein n=1 Tax=Streptomyces platensis TaxID=58346 RepID=UPI001F1CF373|nr:hypothetical protein [Streptomyces platensis]MCF3143803.1 hypothetical protein [Streptomyces platensis]
MSSLDTSAAETSLKKALELLRAPGPGDLDRARQAAQAAVRAVPNEPAKEWSAAEEAQIKALVEQIRKVHHVSRQGPNWWQKKRERRARRRLGDLAVGVDSMELLNEAELRHWKNRSITDALLEYGTGTMAEDDIQILDSRLATVHGATYEDLRRAKRQVAERSKNSTSGEHRAADTSD